jgi:hypothetical protein
MRTARLVLFVLAAFSISQFSIAQQTQAPASPPQRDPQAIAILTQAVNTAGGTPGITAVQDFTGTGNINYFWAGKSVAGSVAVYGKGLDKFRMDADVSGGTQSFIVDGKAGSLTSLYRPKTKLPVYSVMTAGSLTFPAARIANVLNDSTISVSYLGSINWNGFQVYRVHVTPPLDPALSLTTNLTGLGEFDLYIDPASYQLLGLTEKVWWGNDLNQSYSHEILFSNYTTTNGLLVPFVITEKFGGQQTWSLNLSSLTFNTGLSDTLFKP